MRRGGGQYPAFDNRAVAGVRFLTNAPLEEEALVEDVDTALFNALWDVDLPVGSEKSIKPFSLNVSTLDGLTEKQAGQSGAYLVEMARVEALDTMVESRKAVELLDRHVGYCLRSL